MRTLSSLHLLLCALALIMLPACSQEPFFSIPRVDCIRVDGKAGDWCTSGFAVEMLERTSVSGLNRPDPDTTCRLGWDDRGLLILLTVRDTTHVEADRLEETYRFDDAELFVGDAPGTKNFYQAIFHPGMAKRSGKLGTTLKDYRTQQTTTLTMEAVRTRTRDGYVLEVRLPWANLGITPEIGREIGFQVMVNDNDEPFHKERFTEHTVWYPEIGTVWNTARMQRLRLADAASPAVRGVALIRVDEKLQPSVVVTAHPDQAGKAVTATVDGKVVSTGTLAHDASGFATAALPLPWNKGAQITCQVSIDGHTLVVIPPARLTAAVTAWSRELKKDKVVKLDPQDLFEAINLDYPGLEQVKAAVQRGDEDRALKLLLDHYRARTNVWYPIENALGAEVPASPEMLARANDTLKNIFVAREDKLTVFGYAPYNYGKDMDWNADPFNDLGWVSNMHAFFWDQPLASAYLTTKKDKYAKKWVEVTSDWIRKNPVERDKEQIPYAPLVIGVRCWRWCADFELYKQSPAFTPDFLRLFLAGVHDQAERTVQRREIRHNNPTIGDMNGLLRIAVVFPEFKRSPEWQAYGTNLLTETLGKQYTEDGVHMEWSINYHIACTGLVHSTMEFLQKNHQPVPPVFADKVEKMYDYMLAAITPDRLYPMFSDARRPKEITEESLRKVAHDITGSLRRGAAIFDKPHYLAVVDEKPEGYPKQLSYAFPKGGMYFLRSGWDRNAIYMPFHCSPKAASGHDQADNGTFELYAFGRWLMPDTGCYSYEFTNDPTTKFQNERRWFGSTPVHQTLTLDSKNSVNAAKHLLWQDADRYTVAAFENASYPGLTHRRTVFFVDRAFFVLLDEAIGDAKGALDLHFQLAPGPSVVETAKKTARTDFPDGGNVLVWTPQDAPVTMIEEKGEVSFETRKKEPRPAFAYRHNNGQAPASYLTVVVPYQGTTVPTVAAVLPAGDTAGDNRAELTVTLNGKSYRLFRDLATGEAWCKAE